MFLQSRKIENLFKNFTSDVLLSDLRKMCKYRFKKRYDLHVHIYLIENRRRTKKKSKMIFFFWPY